MPQLEDILEKRKKKFVKKAYRPWNLSGKGEAPSVKESTPAQVEKPTVPANPPKVEPVEQTVPEVEKTPTISTSSKGSELGFNRVQKGSKLEFNRVHKGSNKSSLEFNKGSTRVQLNPNSDQTLQLCDEQYLLKKSIKKLSGNERKIFFFIVEICSLKGTLNTGEMLSEDMDEILQMPRNSRETCLKRLKKKGLIIRGTGRRGKNSTVSFSLTEAVKIEALNQLSVTQAEKNVIKNMLGDRVQQGFKDDIYSSSNINTTTNLTDDWKNIDIEPLRHINFSETQLQQLIGKNSPEVVQDSIYHFAFGLKHSPKTQQYAEPLNVFMGVLRKGGAWVEDKYRSPQEIAQEKMLERKRAEAERLKNQAEELYKHAFEEWRARLTQEQIEEYAPPKQSRRDITPQAVKLSLYFKENIWPTKKSDYVDVIDSN